jgi:hypothetical protein
MAAFNKFGDFVEQLVLGKHDFAAAGHVYKAYLTNNVPSAVADAVKVDLPEIAGGNGYTAGGHDMQNAVSEAGGIATVTAVDITITATGGPIGPFQYVVAVNDTQTTPAKPLVNWWDYGAALTLAVTETFTIDFGATWFTLA